VRDDQSRVAEPIIVDLDVFDERDAVFVCRHSRAGDRTRTGDVQLGKLAFYQLNYARSATTKL
jgi:hypothetical protein